MGQAISDPGHDLDLTTGQKMLNPVNLRLTFAGALDCAIHKLGGMPFFPRCNCTQTSNQGFRSGFFKNKAVSASRNCRNDLLITQQSCEKNDTCCQVLGNYGLQNLQAIWARHVHIKQCKVRPKISDGGNCFDAVSAPRNYFERLILTQKCNQPAQNDRMIIHYYNAKRAHGLYFWNTRCCHNQLQ